MFFRNVVACGCRKIAVILQPENKLTFLGTKNATKL